MGTAVLTVSSNITGHDMIAPPAPIELDPPDCLGLEAPAQSAVYAGVGPGDARQHRSFGPLTNAGGTLAITHTLEGTLHLGCQRALAVRNNLAIDVAGCRIDVTDQGVDLLNAVAAKIPH